MYGDPGIAWIRYDVRTVAGTLIVRLVRILQASDRKGRSRLIPVHTPPFHRETTKTQVMRLKIYDLNR
eukprot:scaffold218766_cov50-Attheya_sp.AAC.1